MKLRIELEVDLGNNFINPNDKEEREWLFNHILTKSNLFLHDNEIGDTIGDVTNVVKCEEVKTDVNRSFAFGEYVKVLDCFHGHEFEIGEIVCIVGKSDYDDAWLCRNVEGVEWYLHDEEGEVVNCG